MGIVGRKEGKKQVPTSQLGNREDSPLGIRSLEKGVLGCQGTRRLRSGLPASASLGGVGEEAPAWSLTISPAATGPVQTLLMSWGMVTVQLHSADSGEG